MRNSYKINCYPKWMNFDDLCHLALFIAGETKLVDSIAVLKPCDPYIDTSMPKRAFANRPERKYHPVTYAKSHDSIIKVSLYPTYYLSESGALSDSIITITCKNADIEISGEPYNFGKETYGPNHREQLIVATNLLFGDYEISHINLYDNHHGRNWYEFCYVDVDYISFLRQFSTTEIDMHRINLNTEFELRENGDLVLGSIDDLEVYVDYDRRKNMLKLMFGREFSMYDGEKKFVVMVQSDIPYVAEQ